MSSKRTTTKNSKSRASSRSSSEKSGAGTNHARASQEEFLTAVKSFASTASKEFREELDGLVSRAQRTGSKFADTASKAARAADGRIVELTGSTTREGFDAVRRAAGGLFEGLAQAIAPKSTKTTGTKPAGKKTTSAKKKSVKTATAKRR